MAKAIADERLIQHDSELKGSQQFLSQFCEQMLMLSKYAFRLAPHSLLKARLCHQIKVQVDQAHIQSL